jgi:hypothetical protein
MPIPEQDPHQHFETAREQSQIDQESGSEGLRIEIKQVPVNLNNTNAVAEIFPCK